MTQPAHSIPYGTQPWSQTTWDARAAGNFIGGGVGAGVIVAAALSPASGTTLAILFGVGLACIGAGLASVGLELGRPFRALYVFRKPGTSWMSREAFCAGLVAGALVATIAGVEAFRSLTAILAVAFVYCQARLLNSAKGIPAWHEPRLVPLLVATGLTEGVGLFWLAAPLHGLGNLRLLALLAALILVRAALWRLYRERIAVSSPRASLALEPASRVLAWIGTTLPLLLVAVSLLAEARYATAIAAAAGALALLAGSYAKFLLVTRAGFNRGFVLPQLPVRGAR